jgi:hypothetical protein
MDKLNENIFFAIHDRENSNDVDLTEILMSLENTDIDENAGDLFISQTLNYEVNFNVKELMLICDYYGISKMVKANKCNKTQIVYFVVNFENEPQNEEVVLKRKNIWFYMAEIKNDKFMKKYVLW